jgi:hypothetical protein
MPLYNTTILLKAGVRESGLKIHDRILVSMAKVSTNLNKYFSRGWATSFSGT